MKDYTQLSMYDDLNEPCFSSDDSIDHLALKIRTYNALRRAGVSTIGQLKELVDSGTLITVNGMGEGGVLDVKKALSEIVFSVSQPASTIARKAKGEAVQPKKLRTTKRDQASLLETANVIQTQKLTIEKLITAGLLHPKIQIFGNSLEEWLSENHAVSPSKVYEAFSILLYSSVNIVEELSYLLKGFPDNHIKILITRYGIHKLTLQEIGENVGITRERVRQIGNKLEEKIKNRLEKGLNQVTNPDKFVPTEVRLGFPKIQTALMLATDMGDEITFEQWVQTLNEAGLVGKWVDCNLSGYAPIDVLVAILNIIENTKIAQLKVPNNLLNTLELAIDGTPDLPAKILHVRRTLPPKISKIIRRHTNFSGGVHIRWLSREIKKDQAYLIDVLQAMGYQHLSGDWFISRLKSSNHLITNHDIFHHALRKMSLYCGPLVVDDLCSGIRHTISRERFPAPSPDVLKLMLVIYGYKNEDELYYWDGEIDENLSTGEEILLNCIKQNGPVVHHSQLAQAIIDSNLSFASLHGTLNRTPLIKKIDTALYKIRGKPVTSEDIERAQNVGERIPANVDVQFDKEGNVKVFATIGPLVVGTGVLFSEQLPDLSGKWFSYIGERKFGKLVATEREFRNLVKPLTFLGCKGGDRLQFTFSTWNRNVTIEKVKNDYTD